MTGLHLVLQGVVKRFGAVPVLDGVDLDLASGARGWLSGANGAGKSTLMTIACGGQRPDHGTIRVNGVEHRFKGPRQAQAAGIGMVHQHFQLVPVMTVAENVAYGCKDSACTIQQWIKSSGHRANMLRADINKYGLASATSASGRRYWALEVGE